MAKPTVADMKISLEDTRFFYGQMEPVVRGPEQEQDIELIRRYFRAYLHCWKCIPDFVREVLCLSGNKSDWIAWCGRWSKRLVASDVGVFESLRKTRDHDTHVGAITVNTEVAAGLFPIVTFQPGKGHGPPRELISCCERGLVVIERLIQEYPSV
jgi:hypothetical protein